MNLVLAISIASLPAITCIIMFKVNNKNNQTASIEQVNEGWVVTQEQISPSIFYHDFIKLQIFINAVFINLSRRNVYI